ncbi:TonB-dependent receptor plug domain-containing protein [Sphingomonas hengshuiensis]|uniref:TonB-dependent receptor n=1 Tax=Sphingomonas hengshuiensis TaxID=1609977 RepID=A0A7U5BEL2_9SPHN|nr:TonB-dependent receptor [Sphingomonas hengshuiensis]AJP70798.1 hypothetical protein TS85_01640 [Sphingomonas hengshuiensis]
MRQGLKLLLSTTAIFASFSTGSAAFAQTAPEADPAQEVVDQGGDIVVTATRLQNAGFSAPTPVTTVTEGEIKALAPSSMADVLVSIPSFRMTSTPSTSGVNSRGGGLITADLRGLGATRTLVLVNGRRFVGSGTDGVVDLKLIPSLLVGQVETITGGASAAWGSDAVAGVVNFILKDKMQGLTGSVQTGVSQQGDGQELRASLAGGTSLLDDRLHLSFGADYVNQKGVGTQYTRDWGRKEVGLVSNPLYGTNGQPQYIIASGVHPSLMAPGGLIVSGVLRGTAFNADGTTYQFKYGTQYGTTNSSMIGGSNTGNNLSNATQLAAPYEATILMGTLSYEVAPSVEFFTEVNRASSSSSGFSQQARDVGSLTIRVDNAYLPASVRAAMVANGLSTIAVGRLNNDSGMVSVHSSNRTFRIVSGFKGEIGDGWKWDAYYEYGQNDYTIESGPNNRITANYLLAIDAVVDPTTNTIVCRSTLTNPTNGCKAQNIFGDGSVKVDDYSFGTARFDLTTKQQVASASISGSPFATWAGPISIAAGGEYRKESAEGTSDALSQQVQASGAIGAFQIGNQAPISGAYHVWEGFAEIGVPILKDSALGRALDLNAAVRKTDYSTSGAVTTWKAGVTYKPIDDVMIRATRSRDIRAPNLGELFQAGGSSYVNVFDEVLNSTVQVRNVSQGNLDLKPEKANTWTAGVVLTPSFVRGLSLSVDYYNIEVKDAIGTISAPLVVSQCNAGVTELCKQIVYNTDGSIAYTIAQQLNLNVLKTSGVDAEARYTFGVGAIPGDFGIRAVGSYVDKLVTIDASGTHDYAGKLSNFNRTGGVPHLAGNVDLTYRNDTFSLGLLTRIVGAGKYATELTEGSGAANTINDNHVPAYAYMTLTLSQAIRLGNRSVEFFGVINNLMDTDPPMLPSGTIGGANETSTNPVYYDTIGRAFKVGFRFKL